MRLVDVRFYSLLVILGLLSLLSAGGNFYMAIKLPRLIVSSDVNTPSSKNIPETVMAEGSKMLHIVTTRFMQDQPNLVSLGNARLRLFETFCLPTMIRQEADNFLWFVMTDPNLNSGILNRLKALLDPYPHFYLVASNAKLLTPGNLTSGMEAAESIILTGDLEQLYSQMFDLHRPLLIETRLDADDGLHKMALTDIQQMARDLPIDTRGWQIICNRLHFEWRNNEILEELSHEIQSSGKIRLVREHICTTPGYTLVKHRGSRSVDFPPWPRMGHHLVTRDWPKCQTEGTKNVTHDCWIKLEPYPAALRSRTITSAGMSRVEPTPDGIKYENQTEMFWRVVERDFGISRNFALTTSRFLKDNLEEIILDNLEGQW
jgi:Putative rhamnosyl transferase